MNPLHLPGSQFLIFYVVFAATILVALVSVRRLLERGPITGLASKDPYLAACLRGGPSEVVRLATISLIDRGLVRMSKDIAETMPGVDASRGQTQLERGLLDYFKIPNRVPSAAAQSALIVAATRSYEHRLRSHGLLPDAAGKKLRRTLLVLALLALLGVGGTKLMIALQQGRTNVALLIITMVGASIWAMAIHNPYRTSRGDAYLASMRSLFGDLRRRASQLRPGSGSREVLWLTALFGAAALPTAAFPFAQYFRPAKASGCGTSSGSGCGTGGSSGCGGGGGGCGGCGGA